MMNKLILKRIKLRNFKGEKERETSFNSDGVTTIQGDNGLGKSRHADAFFWCFYGKDMQDRQMGAVKSKDERGNDIHHLTTSVEVEVELNGRPVRLRRELEEKWTQDRFDGNQTKCYVNDVPMSATEYTKRVNELIEEQTFKLLTNPNYFCCNLKEDAQRELLLQMAGQVTNEEIISTSEEYKELFARINDVAVEDYLAIVKAKIKKSKEALEQVQPRIDQTMKMMPEEENWDSLQENVIHCEVKLKAYDERIAKEVRVQQAINKEKEAVAKKMGEQKVKRIERINELRSGYNEAMSQYNERISELDSNKRIALGEVKAIEAEIEQTKTSIDSKQRRIKSMQETLDQKRGEWVEKNALQYSKICPTCGQRLTDEQIAEGLLSFNEKKAKVLERIVAEANAMKEEIETWQTKLNRDELKIDALKAQKDSTLDNINRIDEQKSSMKKPGMFDESIIENDETIKAIDEEMRNIESRMESTEISSSLDIVNSEKEEITRQRDELLARLNKKSIIDSCKEEVKRLEKEGKDLVSVIAQSQRDIDTIERFKKERVVRCEEAINTMFDGVTFKLFDTTLKGDEYQCCQALVDGVPFTLANSAGRMNAGLAIINVLCKHFDTVAPIWIDNAESNNHITQTEAQMILLRVTNDEKLTII